MCTHTDTHALTRTHSLHICTHTHKHTRPMYSYIHTFIHTHSPTSTCHTHITHSSALPLESYLFTKSCDMYAYILKLDVYVRIYVLFGPICVDLLCACVHVCMCVCMCVCVRTARRHLIFGLM